MTSRPVFQRKSGVRYILLLLFAGMLCQVASAQSFWSVGYWEGGGGTGPPPNGTIPWSSLTHFIYWNVITPTVDGSGHYNGLQLSCFNGSICSEASFAAEYKTFAATAHANGVKVIFEIPQIPGSTFNSVATSNPTQFATDMAQAMNDSNFDGVGFDWETSMNGTNLRTLVVDLRNAIGSSKILEVPGFDTNEWITAYSMGSPATHTYLDRYLDETYDWVGTWEPASWFNSALHNNGGACGSSGCANWDSSRQHFINAGWDLSKINFGIPYYGYTVSGVSGPNVTTTSYSVGGQNTYAHVVASYGTTPAGQIDDSNSREPWFPIGGGYLTYDNPQAVTDKVNYAKSNGLGGVFAFSLNKDQIGSTHPLLSAQGAAIGSGGSTAPSITSTSPLSAATVSSSYSVTLSATGTSPITWGVTSGTLPVGLSLNSGTGGISGTPTVSGTSTFTVQATNSAGNNSTAFSLTVAGGTATAPTITTTSPLSAASVNAAYSTTLAANGTTPITWGVTSGTLPTGLSLNSSTGVISGTPTVSGTSTFTVQATNSAGNNSKSLSLTVGASLPVISSFTATPSTVTAGGSTTLAWSVTGATGGISIDQGLGAQTGSSVSATPNGTTTYTLSATNSGGTVKKSVTVTVAIAPDLGTPQPAAMPGRVPTDSDLLVAADHCETTLSANVTSSTLSLPVASLSTCVADQILFMDSEQVKNCSGTSNVFTVCAGGRGFAGTAASSHQQGALVWGRIGGVYHNQTSQELIALATWIGTQAHHGTYPGGVSVNGASWPNHLPTKAELYSASDWTVSQLSAAMGASDVSLTVKDGTGYQANQIVGIDKELMELGSASGTTLGGLLRGIANTTPATHATGASVFGVIAAIEFNVVTLNLHAVEADLYGTAGSTQPGICGTSCAAVSGVSWPNHVFLQSEAGIAVANGAYLAAMQNRVKDEIKALANDLKSHP